jgi:hypothetical protein
MKISYRSQIGRGRSMCPWECLHWPGNTASFIDRMNQPTALFWHMAGLRPRPPWELVCDWTHARRTCVAGAFNLRCLGSRRRRATLWVSWSPAGNNRETCLLSTPMLIGVVGPSIHSMSLVLFLLLLLPFFHAMKTTLRWHAVQANYTTTWSGIELRRCARFSSRRHRGLRSS